MVHAKINMYVYFYQIAKVHSYGITKTAFFTSALKFIFAKSPNLLYKDLKYSRAQQPPTARSPDKHGQIILNPDSYIASILMLQSIGGSIPFWWGCGVDGGGATFGYFVKY